MKNSVMFLTKLLPQPLKFSLLIETHSIDLKEKCEDDSHIISALESLECICNISMFESERFVSRLWLPGSKFKVMSTFVV